MTIQTFKMYTANGYEGELVDSGPRVIQTGVLTSASVGFGKALARDITVDRGVKLGASGNIFAISQREYNHEAQTRPSDGNDFNYLINESVSLIRDGYVRLLVTGAAAVAGTLAATDDATGAFVGGSAGAGQTQTTNVVWEETGIVGDIIKARIILAVA